MGERARYEPGTFCWADLGTDDPEAAKSFYVALFGWETEDVPMGAGGTYTMCTLGDGVVCAIYGRERSQGPSGPLSGGQGPSGPLSGGQGPSGPLSGGQGPSGPLSGGQGPPAWLQYVSVEDADAAAAAARAAGALAVQDPFDVFDAGRMAVVQDPAGAHFAVWEPGRTIGATLVNVPGAMCLNQLNTSDPAGAAAFYTEVFGWRVEQVSTEPMPYWGIWNGAGLNGGMMPLRPGSPAPPHWLLYFATEDVDATSSRTAELGGRVLVPPMAVPGGRIAVATDPTGAAFAFLDGRLDP